jgi:hypothetical protein
MCPKGSTHHLRSRNISNLLAVKPNFVSLHPFLIAWSSTLLLRLGRLQEMILADHDTSISNMHGPRPRPIRGILTALTCEMIISQVWGASGALHDQGAFVVISSLYPKQLAKTPAQHVT